MIDRKYIREVIVTELNSCRKFESAFTRFIDSLSFWPRLFERLDNGIHWINQYIFSITFPLDSNLSIG